MKRIITVNDTVRVCVRVWPLIRIVCVLIPMWRSSRHPIEIPYASQSEFMFKYKWHQTAVDVCAWCLHIASFLTAAWLSGSYSALFTHRYLSLVYDSVYWCVFVNHGAANFPKRPIYTRHGVSNRWLTFFFWSDYNLAFSYLCCLVVGLSGFCFLA